MSKTVNFRSFTGASKVFVTELRGGSLFVNSFFGLNLSFCETHTLSSQSAIPLLSESKLSSKSGHLSKVSHTPSLSESFASHVQLELMEPSHYDAAESYTLHLAPM